MAEFINEDIPRVHPQTYTEEQYALVLALDGYKIKQMDESQHAFAWKNETEVDTYVLHGYQRTLKLRIMGKLKQKLGQN